MDLFKAQGRQKDHEIAITKDWLSWTLMVSGLASRESPFSLWFSHIPGGVFFSLVQAFKSLSLEFNRKISILQFLSMQ